MGPAGTTLVVVKEDVLGKVSRDIPTMLDYKTHISKSKCLQYTGSLCGLCIFIDHEMVERTRRNKANPGNQ